MDADPIEGKAEATRVPVPVAPPRGGPGFWAGLRQGVGFMTGVALVLMLLAGGVAGAGWWAFGSLRNLAATTARELGAGFADASRARVGEAAAGLAEVRSKAVDGAAGAAIATRDAVVSGGAAVGDRAVAVRDSLVGRASGLVGRLSRRSGDEAAKTASPETPAVPAPQPPSEAADTR